MFYKDRHNALGKHRKAVNTPKGLILEFSGHFDLSEVRLFRLADGSLLPTADLGVRFHFSTDVQIERVLLPICGVVMT